MAKYRFRRGEDGTIVVRAERILGKQLVTSVTKVLGPGEDVSAAMKELYSEVHKIPVPGPRAEGTASKRRVGE